MKLRTECPSAPIWRRHCKRALLLSGFAVVFATAVRAGDDISEATRNRQTVRAFYETALNQKDMDSALPYFGLHYIQHNPHAKDGIDGFRAYVAYLSANHPRSHWNIKRILTDGTFVIVHSHEVLDPGDIGSAVIDIFRLEAGRIVEHWDVVQAIPSEPANTNSMF